MNTTVPNLISIGRLVPIVHALPDQIREVAAELGISPAMKLDGRELFDERDVERLKERMARRFSEQS